MTRVLSIDPSIKAMGWAILDVHTLNPAPKMSHIISGCLKQTKDYDLEKAADLLKRIDECTSFSRDLIAKHRPHYVVIEEPQIFGAGGTDKASAANNSGAVLKLNAVVYSIRSMVQYSDFRHDPRPPLPILLKVTKWKGNSPKRVTQLRVQRDLGVDFSDHNQMDAIGIGRYFIKQVLPKIQIRNKPRPGVNPISPCCNELSSISGVGFICTSCNKYWEQPKGGTTAEYFSRQD